MARIAGINIPPNQHAEIGLTAIYGIGRARSRHILDAVGVAHTKKIKELNDAELERILSESCKAGATRAGYVLLRLPLEIRGMFEEWVRSHFPDRAARILALVRETRAGAMYDSRFGTRQTGTGPYADTLAHRFTLAARRLGFGNSRVVSQGLDCSQFAPPPETPAPARQLELL